MVHSFLNEYYECLLLNLINVNTVTPMETNSPSENLRALNIYKTAAHKLGFKTIYLKSPSKEDVLTDKTPQIVIQHYESMGETFLSSQPNLVLEYGNAKHINQTIMFNFHIDTVEGYIPGSYKNGVFTGRGAVDMKGPAVALLAGIDAALKEVPSLKDNTRILIQAVSGEEGGAMGIYGTKLMCQKGYLGSLNIFVEPTEGYFIDKSTTSMTANIVVKGEDSTDDAPNSGHNATLILGFLAQSMMKPLSEKLNAIGAKICLSGLYTGSMHNKIYGSGSLKFNFAYPSIEVQKIIEREVEATYHQSLREFKDKFRDTVEITRTVNTIEDITELKWLKKGLPVLNNRNNFFERLLYDAGLKRLPSQLSNKAFTCDAMWAQKENNYTIVYGPGSLEKNHAHSNNEFINKNQLESFCNDIKNILLCFNKNSQKQKVII
ncbi:M20/M25/M40 family metallo-hydrolase [Bacillus cereus]|uniref:M20/M25/M40 family metallo-hydrolase n=1 Tax=Bacillus TaxID=1386 RepID=UPI00068DC5E6|nr:M20/M25/M40 family metallo-hydrolase [Bacillus sp. UNC322MFChir4.1]